MVTKADRRYIFDRDKVCLKCGTSDDLTIDHIVPLTNGGSNKRFNLQTLCQPCNEDKSDTTVDYRVYFGLKRPLTNEEINDKYFKDCDISGRCECDRLEVCTLMGECFKSMDILKGLNERHTLLIDKAITIPQALRVLNLTEHDAAILRKKIKAAKILRKRAAKASETKNILWDGNMGKIPGRKPELYSKEGLIHEGVTCKKIGHLKVKLSDVLIIGTPAYHYEPDNKIVF